jgi:uncharacterized protein YbcI
MDIPGYGEMLLAVPCLLCYLFKGRFSLLRQRCEGRSVSKHDTLPYDYIYDQRPLPEVELSFFEYICIEVPIIALYFVNRTAQDASSLSVKNLCAPSLYKVRTTTNVNTLKRTKGQIEAKICEAVTQFEKEYMGRGPLEIKAYILDDMVLVRLKNVLTQAEIKLAEASGSKDGRELIKRIRIALLEQGRPLLESALEAILEVKIISLHTDISTVTGERVILFSLATPVVFTQSSSR